RTRLRRTPDSRTAPCPSRRREATATPARSGSRSRPRRALHQHFVEHRDSSSRHYRLLGLWPTDRYHIKTGTAKGTRPPSDTLVRCRTDRNDVAPYTVPFHPCAARLAATALQVSIGPGFAVLRWLLHPRSGLLPPTPIHYQTKRKQQ